MRIQLQLASRVAQCPLISGARHHKPPRIPRRARKQRDIANVKFQCAAAISRAGSRQSAPYTRHQRGSYRKILPGLIINRQTTFQAHDAGMGINALDIDHLPHVRRRNPRHIRLVRSSGHALDDVVDKRTGLLQHVVGKIDFC